MKERSKKRAFIAGIGDDNGYGWAIAKALAQRGVEIIAGIWPPIFTIFQKSLAAGKFEASRLISHGKRLEFAAIYPLDATLDRPEDVPFELRTNKRYAHLKGYTLFEVAQATERQFGQIDYFVHALANGPEVKKSLLDTSRSGYLQALSASAYSLVSCVRYFGPIMNPGGGFVSLSYLAAERVVPGYGGGMSSAKAALESDTRTLAYEAGRRFKIRVNTISAGPLKSRAAKAIGTIDNMIDYYIANAPLQQPLAAQDVAVAARFLLSEEAKAITGTTLYVDNGMHVMAVAENSASFKLG